MKFPKKRVILFPIFILHIITATTVTAGPLIQSSTEITTWGFPNSRGEKNTRLNTKALLNTKHSVYLHLKNNRVLVTGFRHSSITESQIFSHLKIQRGNLGIDTGVSLGFLNKLPLTVTPGLYGKLTVGLWDLLHISVYGKTSIFLSPLISLSPSELQFDQNLFGFSVAHPINGAELLILYENENLKTKASDTSITRNGKKRYEMSINTRRDDFRINSSTGVGGEIALFKTALTHQKLIGFYLFETLHCRIKTIVVSLGLKGYILSIPLKDLEPAAIPTFPIFSLQSGVQFRL